MTALKSSQLETPMTTPWPLASNTYCQLLMALWNVASDGQYDAFET
jgi:hypothetical protein